MNTRRVGQRVGRRRVGGRRDWGRRALVEGAHAATARPDLPYSERLPVRSIVFLRATRCERLRPTNRHPPPTCDCSSSELGTATKSSSIGDPGVPGGGGMSKMKSSWCAMRNSRTFWLSRCSFGESSCEGCEIMPGRKITARSGGGMSVPRSIKGKVAWRPWTQLRRS